MEELGGKNAPFLRTPSQFRVHLEALEKPLVPQRPKYFTLEFVVEFFLAFHFVVKSQPNHIVTGRIGLL